MPKEETVCRSAMFVIFGVAAALAAVLYATTPTAGASSPKMISVFEHDTSQVNIPPGGNPSDAGNLFIYAGDVFDHAGGTKLGRAAGYVQTMSPSDAHNPGEVFGTLSLVLARGQIMAEGLVNGADLFVNGKTLSFPITGGTGAYDGAPGYATVRVPPDVPNETDAFFVLHLI